MQHLAVVHENREAIGEALAHVNGRAKRHAWTSYSCIVAATLRATEWLERINLPPSNWKGARFTVSSGRPFPGPRKFGARGTAISLRWSGKAWVLERAESVTVKPHTADKGTLWLRRRQIDSAIDHTMAGCEPLD